MNARTCREFGYEANDRWQQMPAGWTWKEVAGVATDSKDRVYVFNRGEHPVIIFGRDGSFLGSWGEGLFARPHGITIGPEASDAALAARRVELTMQPERFIAQDVVHLSTHPTFDGTGFHPHHVDLRAFVHLRPGRDGPTAHVAPAPLTRVAPPGSMIVNSSKGGGGKDTWILA